MKINMTPTPGTLVDIELADGTKLTDKEVRSISLDPYFTKRAEVIELLNVVVKPRSRDESDNCVLMISGITGKISRRDSVARRKRVTPVIDEPLTKVKQTTE